MTERTQEYAALAAGTYQDLLIGDRIRAGNDDYVVFAAAASPISGFRAAAFRDESNGRTVLAYRGTDGADDYVVDAAMFSAKINVQQWEADAFTRHAIDLAEDYAAASHKPLNVTVTGHSLGGTLAQINASKYHLHGETFNAYGAVGLGKDIYPGGHEMINHARAGDPVSAANQQFGEVKIYATPDDIARMAHAGYGSGNAGAVTRSISVQSHYMDNFIPKGGETPLIGPEGEARYKANQTMVDHYRTDVMGAREVANHVAGSPTLLGPALVIRAGQAYAHNLRNDGQELISRMTPIGRAVGQASVEASDAIGTGVNHIGHGAIAGARALGMVPSYGADAVWGLSTGSPELERLIHPAKLNDAAHPAHAMFQQALRGVHAIDASTGRSPDQMSENLAGALTVEARRNGMSRIDHVVMNDDFSRAYAVQGEANSPFKKFAEVPTEVGVATSIDHSSAAWQQAVSQNAPQQADVTQAIAPTSQTEAPPAHSPHSLSR
jgi:hypothetical protein